MEWLYLLQDIHTYLTNKQVADIILQGFSDGEGVNVADKNIVCITMAGETYSHAYNGGEGTVTLYVDMFTQYVGKDMSGGYLKIATLEDKVRLAIQEWCSQGKPSQKVTVLETRITGVTPNLEMHRPVIGSYFTIEIDWSRRTL